MFEDKREEEEMGGAVRGRGGRGEDWALSGCNGESPGNEL